MRSRPLRPILAWLVVVSACASTAPQSSSAGGESHDPPVGAPPAPDTGTCAETSAPSASATAFVARLAAMAGESTRASVDDCVDEAFAARLSSGPELASLFVGIPTGCTPVLEEGPGYGAVAIPPPMDDALEDVTRIEALIEELQASTEVTASCVMRMQECDGEETSIRRETVMLYAIAVRETDGGYRAIAWRDFRDERPNEH